MSGSYWEIWLDDPNGTRLSLLDKVQTFAVSRVANAIGVCALVLPAEYDALIRLDSIIEFWRRASDGALKLFNAYFVRKWRFEEASNGADVTLLWGYDGNYLLDGRIVAYDAESAQALMTDQLDDMMKAIATDNIGADAATGRALTSVGGGVTVAADLAAAPSATKGFSWTNVLETMVDLAMTSRAGGTNLYFDMVPAFTSAGLISWQFQTFTTQRGADRSSDSANPVFFGREWGNLEEGYFEIDHSEEYNYIYGRGQGTTTSRIGAGGTACDASDSTRYGASIWNRREGFANAAAGGGGESEASTLAEAKATLEKGRPKWRAGGKLLDTGQARYDIDWTFGDVITIEIRGQQFDAEVTAVGFAVDENGQETPDFRVEVEGV